MQSRSDPESKRGDFPSPGAGTAEGTVLLILDGDAAVLNAEQDAVKRWSTAEVPQARRLDYFAAALSEAIFPVTIGNADSATFQAESRFAHVGALGVCKTTASPHAGFRGRSELARSSDHSFNLVLANAHWTIDHRGKVQMSPYDVLIFDSEYPLRVDLRTSFVAINVSVAESWLRQWIPNPTLVAARIIPGNSSWGHALSSFLSGLSPELAASPPVPLTILADQVGALLALTASVMGGAPLAATPAVRSLLERIQDHLAQRCTEWQLTAEDVAASLGISPRTLHRAFAATNQTFGEALIEARARVALRMLNSPSFNRITTAEIGRRAGFPSASHFARVIRNRTGRTPLALRHELHPHALEHHRKKQELS